MAAGIRRRSRRTRFSAAAALLAAALCLAPSGALADHYDRANAGHPLRIAAYVLHPVGVAFDWLVMRPAHWVGSLPVLDHIFGHDPEY